jgi:hypothetical protein
LAAQEYLVSRVSYLTWIKAILFDLHNTLVYKKDNVEFEEVSKYLFSKDYEISSQQFEAAWSRAPSPKKMVIGLRSTCI